MAQKWQKAAFSILLEDSIWPCVFERSLFMFTRAELYLFDQKYSKKWNIIAI